MRPGTCKVADNLGPSWNTLTTPVTLRTIVVMNFVRFLAARFVLRFLEHVSSGPPIQSYHQMKTTVLSSNEN